MTSTKEGGLVMRLPSVPTHEFHRVQLSPNVWVWIAKQKEST